MLFRAFHTAQTYSISVASSPMFPWILPGVNGSCPIFVATPRPQMPLVLLQAAACFVGALLSSPCRSQAPDLCVGTAFVIRFRWVRRCFLHLFSTRFNHVGSGWEGDMRDYITPVELGSIFKQTGGNLGWDHAIRSCCRQHPIKKTCQHILVYSINRWTTQESIPRLIKAPVKSYQRDSGQPRRNHGEQTRKKTLQGPKHHQRRIWNDAMIASNLSISILPITTMKKWT